MPGATAAGMRVGHSWEWRQWVKDSRHGALYTEGLRWDAVHSAGGRHLEAVLDVACHQLLKSALWDSGDKDGALSGVAVPLLLGQLLTIPGKVEGREG